MMKLQCLTCKAIRQTFGEYSDPSIVCPTCRGAAPLPPDPGHGMRSPNRNARKRRRDDDEEDDDHDARTSGGDVATAAGTAAGVAGLGIGMVLLIVGGIAACCLCLPIGGSLAIFALVLPAVQKAQTAQQRVTALNNVKEMALACHGFHDRFMHLPSPQIQPAMGAVPQDLSWRVSILENIDPGLFNTIDRTQGWNAGKNAGLIGRMPRTYHDPFNSNFGQSQTRYQYFTGANTIFPQPLTKITLQAIRDGTSNTFLIAEGSATVPWAKLADITNGPTGAKQGDFFIAAMADGSARAVNRKNAGDEVLRLLINPNDGQMLPAGWDN